MSQKAPAKTYLVEMALVFCVVCLALWLRIPEMLRGFNYDELYSVTNYIQPGRFLDIFQNHWLTSHLGYTIIGFFTYHSLGRTEWALRLPALFFGIGSLVLLWYWVRRYWGRGVALMAMLLLTISPPHVLWSASARGYSALIFFSILSSALYFLALERPSARIFWSSIVVNVIALSFHVFFLSILLTQFLCLLGMVLWNRKGTTRAYAGGGLKAVGAALGMSVLLAAIVYLPLTMTTWTKALGMVTWSPLDPRSLVKILGELLSLHSWTSGFAAIMLACAGAFYLSRKFAAGLSYIIYLLVVFWAGWLLQIYFCTRFNAYLMPFLFCLIAGGAVFLANCFRGLARYFMIVVVAFLLGSIVWDWRHEPSVLVNEYKHSYREAGQFANKTFPADTRFCAFGSDAKNFTYYADRPVTIIKTLDDLRVLNEQYGDVACFTLPGVYLNDEEKKILLVFLKYGKLKQFNEVAVLFIKGERR